MPAYKIRELPKSERNQFINVQTAKRVTPPIEQRSEQFHLPALSVLCLIVFFYGLGSLPLLGPDEPRYAQVAREMYESGDWITPRLAGLHWFEKPALTYWLAAAGYTLFGVSEFAARCGVAVLASVSVLLLYWFGRRVHSARYGYLSAATLLTCGLWPGFARGATFDLPLSACLALALVCFFVWEQQADEPNRSDALWWLFCGALGLAVLAKGLVGLVLPVAIAGLYLLLTWRWRIVLRPRLLVAGTLLLLGVAALWYGPMLARHGQEFVDEFFVRHHFQRYTSNKYKHPQPFYFFFLVVLAGSFPWLPFLLASVLRVLRAGPSRMREPAQRLRLFLWLWVLVPLLFFSFSGSKLPGYILPVFPALALLIGLELERWWTTPTARSLQLSGVATGLLLLAAAAGVLVLGRQELDITQFQASALAGVTALVALLYLGFLLFKSGRAATLFLPAGIAAMLLATVHLLFPALGQRESLRELFSAVKQAAQPSERLVFYVNSDHGIDFYAPELPLRDATSDLRTVTSNAEILQVWQGGESLLLLSPQRWAGDVANATVLFEDTRKLRCSPGCNWVLLRVRRTEK